MYMGACKHGIEQHVIRALDHEGTSVQQASLHGRCGMKTREARTHKRCKRSKAVRHTSTRDAKDARLYGIQEKYFNMEPMHK